MIKNEGYENRYNMWKEEVTKFCELAKISEEGFYRILEDTEMFSIFRNLYSWKESTWFIEDFGKEYGYERTGLIERKLEEERRNA